MKFKKIETGVKDLFIIEPQIFEDTRGFFLESYNYNDFKELGIENIFVQDNHSKSLKGVLRGLHFQKEKYSQAKLVRVIKGKVLDVAVDIRRSSPTFGKHIMVELSDDIKKQFFIPRGFAHGFLVLSNEAIFTYKVDNAYAPQHEANICWNDPELNIKWPIDPAKIITSQKDLAAPLLKNAEVFD